MTGVNSPSAINTEVKTETAARCSIILLAGSDFSRLNVYLLCLSEMKLPDNYEIIIINDHNTKINEGQLRTFLPSLKVLSPGGFLSQERLFNEAAMAASGRFLLFIRNFINFDKMVLEESINELETSGEKLSISANKNIILLENNFYLPKANLGRAKEEFWKLHIGCGSKHFPGYINIDIRKTKATDYVCSATQLPFPDTSVGLIETYHLIEHLPMYDLPKVLTEWWRVLVPGGKLVIECPDFDKTVEEYLEGNEKRLNNIFGLRRFKGDAHLWGYNFVRLKRVLEKYGYEGVKQCAPQDYHRIEEPCMRVEAHKSLKHFKKNSEATWRERMEKRPETLTLAWRERHIHTKILYELKDQLFEQRSVISLGCGSGELEVILGREGHHITGIDVSDDALQVAEKHRKEEHLDNVQFIKASIDNMPFPANSFDSAIMLEVLEHISYSDTEEIFTEIKRVLKPHAKLLITVPNKFAYGDPGHIQVFTKGRLAELLDEQGLSIEWMDWEIRTDAYREHDMLKVMCTNKPKIYHQNRKICAIGAYSIRYDELGFHWDGQIRAFHSLGYNPLFLDIRRDTYKNLREKIIEFNPDILWLGLKDCLPLIERMEKDLKKMRCTVVYWFCDLSGIEGLGGALPLKNPIIDPNKIGDLLDYIFLSNTGQIGAYKKGYNVKNVYYMPQACTPAFMHKVPAYKACEVGFAGSLGNNVFHQERSKLLKNLSKKYKVHIKNDVRNNIAQFYASSKIVLGAGAIGQGSEFYPELCTSNRFFVALGCGLFYLCQWFPGIEKLAKNHEHIVWFKNENELFELIDYYIAHEKKREEIGENAQELANSKHTYVHRIQNMLDIIDAKTDGFDGFLEL